MLWTVHLDGGPKRVNHAAAIVGDIIYSFGGYCTGGDYTPDGPIDIFALNTNTLRWWVIPQKKDEDGNPLKYPEVPFQRYGHTVVEYKDKIYLWGGRNDDAPCNIVFEYDTHTLSWSRPEVTGAIPGARDGHSACVVNNFMYVFGGFEEDLGQFSHDVHRLNLDTMVWDFVRAIGTPPSFRDFHSAAFMLNRMYIFGGRGDVHSPYHSQEEVYCPEIMYLDTITHVWRKPNATGNVPVGRRSHSMFVYNDLLYVFGGFNGILNQHFNDLYSFDPKSNRWSLVKPRGKAPSPRRRQVCLVNRTKMILFAGTSPYVYASDSTIVSPLIDNNDMYILDFEPSLKTLSLMVVIENQMDPVWLPKEIRWEIRAMTTPNSISRPNNHAG